jgi:3-phenylpropionate/cinnamic acid dioxygenase small subunit
MTTDDVNLMIEVQALYTECASALDGRDFERFLRCFARECSYAIRAKENVDRGWPIAIVSCNNRGMLVDRVAAIQKSSFIIPRVQRRIISGIRLARAEYPLQAQASFAVFETFEGLPTTLFMAGRFEDQICREDGALKFADRCCILDSSIVPNSLPYPI